MRLLKGLALGFKYVELLTSLVTIDHVVDNKFIHKSSNTSLMAKQLHEYEILIIFHNVPHKMNIKDNHGTRTDKASNS